MYCENCGKKIEDSSKFCQYCGTKVEADVSEDLFVLQENISGKTDVGKRNGEGAEKRAGEATKEKAAGQKKSRHRIIMAIAAVAVIALAVFIGVSIYNKPENRLARALDLGQKYLLEENYEQAIVEFDKVIQIEPMNVNAYLGKAEAYVKLDDYEMAIETLEKGYQATEEDDSIKDNLVDIYIEVAEDTSENGAYEDSLEIYDRLLELDKRNKGIQNSLGKCLNQYIEILLKEGKYDEIQKLIEKYKELAVNVDFDKVTEAIEYKKVLDELNGMLLQIAKVCKAEEYSNAFALMSGGNYQNLLEEVNEDAYITDTEYGSIGVYKVDSEVYGKYMIYYGEYSEGIREGNGVWVGVQNVNNYIAKGSFHGDVPNGEFEVRAQCDIFDESVRYRVISGNIENGLWNGNVLWKFELNDDNVKTYPVSFEKGSWVVLRYKDDVGGMVSEHTLEDTNSGTMSAVDLSVLEGIVGFADNRE